MASSTDLEAQIREASTPVYMHSKAEIVEYYQENYTHWRTPLVKELADITGLKKHNLQRRLDPSRLNAIPRSAKAKEEYKQLGERLPPREYQAPENGYLVIFSGSILIAGEYCEKRNFTLTITGEAADELASQMEWGTIFDEYFKEDDLAEDICDEEPQVSITAA